MRENLCFQSSKTPTDSNQSAQLQALARILKLRLELVGLLNFPDSE